MPVIGILVSTSDALVIEPMTSEKRLNFVKEHQGRSFCSGHSVFSHATYFPTSTETKEENVLNKLDL